MTAPRMLWNINAYACVYCVYYVVNVTPEVMCWCGGKLLVQARS